MVSFNQRLNRHADKLGKSIGILSGVKKNDTKKWMQFGRFTDNLSEQLFAGGSIRGEQSVLVSGVYRNCGRRGAGVAPNN